MNKVSGLIYFRLSILLVFCWLGSVAHGERAEEVWNRLVGPDRLNQSAFAFVANNPELPNVLIYGDSISIHYTVALREYLKGKANLYRLHCNGEDSSTFISKMRTLENSMRAEAVEGRWTFDWDVIQFNVGLHDLKYMFEGDLNKEKGTQVASIDNYQENLRAIIAYLKTRWPKAIIVFATTTPVPEGSAGRFAGDARRYNEAALEVLEQYPEVRINDLYTFTKPHQEAWWTRPGNVHYGTEGSTSQAIAVGSFILNLLNASEK